MSNYKIVSKRRAMWVVTASCPECGWIGSRHGADLRAEAETAAQLEARAHVEDAHQEEAIA